MNKKQFAKEKNKYLQKSYKEYIDFIKWYDGYIDDVVFEGTRILTATTKDGVIIAVRVQKTSDAVKFEVHNYDYYVDKGQWMVYESLDITEATKSNSNIMMGGFNEDGQKGLFVINKRYR